MTMGIGYCCFGLTVLRHSHGTYVDVPSTAPLLDQAIWVFGNACIVGGGLLLFGWLWARSVHIERMRDEQDSDA